MLPSRPVSVSDITVTVDCRLKKKKKKKKKKKREKKEKEKKVLCFTKSSLLIRHAQMILMSGETIDGNARLS